MLDEQTNAPVLIPPPILYTDDIPVLTPELLAEFRNITCSAADEQFRATVEKIRLSPSPNVFKNMGDDFLGADVPNEEVRIWRQDLPDRVQEFVACALDLLGGEILGDQPTRYLPAYLHLNKAGKLASWKGPEITKEDIAARYIMAGIDRRLCMAFADYYMRSFKSVLSHFPAGYSLNRTSSPKYSRYNCATIDRLRWHPDLNPNLLWQFSDPGTPYRITSKTLSLTYRTQAGDLIIHGNSAEHADTTSPLLPDGSERPRFFMLYSINAANKP